MVLVETLIKTDARHGAQEAQENKTRNVRAKMAAGDDAVMHLYTARQPATRLVFRFFASSFRRSRALSRRRETRPSGPAPADTSLRYFG